MHGADRDIVWLQRDFGIYICNLFDTGQVCTSKSLIVGIYIQALYLLLFVSVGKNLILWLVYFSVLWFHQKLIFPSS